jgi:cell division protein FtsN
MSTPSRRRRREHQRWDPAAYPGQRRARRVLVGVAAAVVVVGAGLLILANHGSSSPQPTGSTSPTPAPSSSASGAAADRSAGSVAVITRLVREPATHPAIGDHRRKDVHA